ncbi:MAG: transglutaminase family protein, partial [Fibrobacteria bacterium]
PRLAAFVRLATFPRFPALAAILILGQLSACRLERPDAASQAAAILNKHPADFLDQLASLDALALREIGSTGKSIVAESLYSYSQRLKPILAAIPPAGAEADSARVPFDSARNSFDSIRIAVLNAFFFDTLGIAADTVGADFATSVPSLVIQRRRGACVGLALLYVALGRSLDLDFVPVFLPGHIFVRYLPRAGEPRNVETLRRGIARSDSFYRERFTLVKRPWYSLGNARPEQALAALVFNLGNAHRSAGDLAASQEEFRLVESVLPGFPEALGSWGACLMMAGDKVGAKARLLAALAGDSLSAPAALNLAELEK